MKKIEIKSRYSKDKITKAQGKEVEQQKDISYFEQIKKLNLAYLTGDKCDVHQEIKKKISSYAQQDKRRDIFDSKKLINFDQCTEKLVLSKLKCYYCRCDMLLMYKDKREPMQWTLDRLDNNIGHFNNNVVICCLNCNLKKRRMDDEKFKFTKQLNIIKGF